MADRVRRLVPAVLAALPKPASDESPAAAAMRAAAEAGAPAVAAPASMIARLPSLLRAAGRSTADAAVAHPTTALLDPVAVSLLRSGCPPAHRAEHARAPTAGQLVGPGPAHGAALVPWRRGHLAGQALRTSDGGCDLPGERIAEGLLLIESRYALPIGVRAACADPALHALFGVAAGAGLLAVDAETTGLAGGTGTLIFLLGQAQPVGAELVIRQWLLTRPSAEAVLLGHAAAEAGAAGALLSFNGKSFDLPLLATRCRLHGVKDRWGSQPHWDLLHALRAAYASRWPDCRLRTAERRLLGLERTDDVPGHLAQQAWFAYLRHGRAPLLRGLIAHNRQDLLSLYALLPVLHAALADPVRYGADAEAIARRIERAGGRRAARRAATRHAAAAD